MFDKHMICDDSLSNLVEGGEVVGFTFQARLPYYRGLGLSMVEELGVTVDGAAIDRAAVSLTLRGKTWTLDELETEYVERWNFGEAGQITVRHPGGLTPGVHTVELAERLRISYLPFTPTTKAKKDLTLAQAA